MCVILKMPDSVLCFHCFNQCSNLFYYYYLIVWTSDISVEQKALNTTSVICTTFIENSTVFILYTFPPSVHTKALRIREKWSRKILLVWNKKAGLILVGLPCFSWTDFNPLCTSVFGKLISDNMVFSENVISCSLRSLLVFLSDVARPLQVNLYIYINWYKAFWSPKNMESHLGLYYFCSHTV